MIAKDAAQHIANALQSVQWADEIVLLDGHSTDDTREIAQRYGVRVIQKDFESFPAERQYVLKHTTHDWVFELDADMIVPDPLAQEIQALLRDGPSCDGYRMRCLNHFLGREIRHSSWFDCKFLRLFNKRKGSYDLTLRVLDHFQCRGAVGTLQHFLVHHQTESLELYLSKMVRSYAPLTADEYIGKGVRIRPANMPWYFLIRPGLTFVYKYIVKRGFLDGIPGLLICLNSAMLYYCVFTIIWDRQRGAPDYRLERYLPEFPRPQRGDAITPPAKEEHATMNAAPTTAPAGSSRRPAAPLCSAHFDAEVEALTDEQLWQQHYAPPSPGRQYRLDLLRRALHGQPGETILDVGCGPGALAFWAARTGAVVLGVDYSRSALAAARRIARRGAATSLWYVQADAVRLPIRDSQFTKVVCVDVFDVLPPELHHPLLCELLRVATPDGHVFLYTPNGRRELLGRMIRPLRRAFGAWQRPANPYLGLTGPTRFRRLLRQNGAAGRLTHADMNYPWIPKIPVLRAWLSGHMLWQITRR
jgi:SAM-dependent methyltransferase/glycosyltransferase involved in cell wall biosynthesis